ncbi:MAG: hypothetical protein N4A45_08735 [Flavobacteriales bacterium]|jgi:hypothetical protein|nr:hypothetical protein [Flavobacteriales bacterium]
MTTEQYIKTGRLTALFTFIIGTIIFSLYYLTSAFEILLVGYGFIALNGLINIVILIAILIKIQNAKTNRKRLQNTSVLMFLNIPIMIAYCLVAINLLGTMRINFTNETNTTITDVNIVGCGG